jgi:hypothetical protein
MPIILSGLNKMYIMTGAAGCGGSMMMRGTIALMLGVDSGGRGKILAHDVDDDNDDDACIDRRLLAILQGLQRHSVSNNAGTLVVVRVDAFPDEAAARVGLEPVRADGHPRPSQIRIGHLPDGSHPRAVRRTAQRCCRIVVINRSGWKEDKQRWQDEGGGSVAALDIPRLP